MCYIFSTFLPFFLVSFLPSFHPSFLRPFIVLIHVRTMIKILCICTLLLFLFFGKPYLMDGIAQNSDTSVLEAQKWTFSLAFIFPLSPSLSPYDCSVPSCFVYLSMSRIRFLMNLYCSRNARDSWTVYCVRKLFRPRRKREGDRETETRPVFDRIHIGGSPFYLWRCRRPWKRRSPFSRRII